jgi:hypothetical protein
MRGQIENMKELFPLVNLELKTISQILDENIKYEKNYTIGNGIFTFNLNGVVFHEINSAYDVPVGCKFTKLKYCGYMLEYIKNTQSIRHQIEMYINDEERDNNHEFIENLITNETIILNVLENITKKTEVESKYKIANMVLKSLKIPRTLHSQYKLGISVTSYIYN